MERIKKNDTVVIISGKEKGKSGAVIEISTKKNAVRVKQVMLMVKHQKPQRMGQAGGLKKIESWINVSKVMPVCSSCKKVTRMHTNVVESGVRVRSCGKCKESF